MAQGHKTGGRRRGTPNRITRAFRDAVQTVYHDIGGDQAFAKWARENQSDFYKIASRLIPSEVNMHGTEGITVIVRRLSDPHDLESSAAEGQATVPSLGYVEH